MNRRYSISIYAAGLAIACIASPSFALYASEAPGQGNRLPSVCFGDCNMDGKVMIDEVVTLVGTALGNLPVTACPGFTEPPIVADLVRGVRNLLAECPLSITYQLNAPSTILVSQGRSFPPPSPQPLTGHFTVIVSSPLPPNTLLGLTLMRINFTGGGVSVMEGNFLRVGCSLEPSFGCISADTINPPPATFMSAWVTIANESFQLSGSGPFEGDPIPPPYDGTSPPPSFNDIEICGRATQPLAVLCADIRSGAEPGYLLTLFATPDGP